MGTYLRSADSDIDAFNQGLDGQARGAIETRRQRILAHREHVAATGLPTRKSEDRNTTYVADAIVRRPAPPLESRPLDKPISLEPVLAEQVYEDVLGILRSTCLSMERSPRTYLAMGEEDRRQVLLIPLNTQYRGQASAEAFNVTGKTDILLKWEGQNLFIAECKIWRGVKSFTDAVDQLFSYAAWRDTKLAVVMFVGDEEPLRHHREGARGARRPRAVRSVGRRRQRAGVARNDALARRRPARRAAQRLLRAHPNMS